MNLSKQLSAIDYYLTDFDMSPDSIVFDITDIRSEEYQLKYYIDDKYYEVIHLGKVIYYADDEMAVMAFLKELNQ